MGIIRSKTFLKQTKHLKDKKTKERLFKQIEKIIDDPKVGDLLSHEKGVRKIYIPPFRLLYSYKDNKLYLLDFENRDKVYKKRR
jgi:mRNA-degrading endonuclease RelE of RelBE toxin-antitoxin system